MELKNRLTINYNLILFTALFSIIGLMVLTPLVSAQDDYSIPSWIKTISKFWASDDISDQEFLSALQYLVSEKILVIPTNTNDDDHHVDEKPMAIQPSPMESVDSVSLIVSEINLECGKDNICVTFSLSTLSKTEPDNYVMSVLQGIIASWDEEKVSCHKDAHHLGHFVYEFFDRDIEKALSYTNNKCGNALYHGVIEDSLLFESRTNDISIEDLDVTSTCNKIGDSITSNIRQQCVHAMGHAIVLVYDGDLFNAIKRCDEFETAQEQEACLDGSFMQNHVAIFNSEGGVFDEEDIYYPCNNMDEKYQKWCYIYQAYYILRENNYSYLPSFEDCENIPTADEKIIGGCIGGVANYMSAHIYTTNVDKIAKMCNEANPEYQSYCINVAVFSLTRYVDTQLAEDFCYSLPDEKTAKCLNQWEYVKRTSNLT